MKFMEPAMYLADLVKGRILGRAIPLTVSLTITNRCNYKCIYCYGDYFNRKDDDVPLRTWLDLIDELATMGTRMIHLGGGEPLLRNDIGEMIDHVKGHGMMCRINTNGALVPKKIGELKKADSICVSLDGKEEANDRNRGEGTFKEIIAGIKASQAAGIPTHVSATVTQNSIESLEEVLELAEEMNFKVEFGLPYEVCYTSRQVEETKLEDENMKKFLTKVLKYKAEGAPIFYSDSTYEYALNWPDNYSKKMLNEEELNGRDYLECYMGRYMCFVDGDGLVYPCGQLIGTFPALNFMEVGFKEAWENLEKHKDCKTCYCPCFTEFNQVYGLKTNVIAGNIKRELKNIF